jgi:hypothetical protein
MRPITGFLLSAALALAWGCGGKKTSDSGDITAIEDLLVKNNEITGWTYSGEAWSAYSYSDLAYYIDGEADWYDRHGFKEATRQTYQGTIDNGTRTLRLTIYNQGTESNALDTFEDPEIQPSGAVDWTDGAGEAAKYRRWGLSQLLIFYRGPYFVYLEMSDYDTEESLNILKQFALNVDGKIE